MKQIFEKAGVLVTIISAASLILGSLSWNSLLGRYGFFEYNFLQTRYFSAGLLFLLFGVCSFSIIYFIFSTLLKFLGKIPKILISKQLVKEKNLLVKVINIPGTAKFFFQAITVGLVVITLFYGFIDWIFPRVYQQWGGARPILLSIIGTPEQISYLENFSINPAKNSEGKESVQSEAICLIYQNPDWAILGIVGQEGETTFIRRVIQLDKRLISGFNVNLLSPNGRTAEYAFCRGFIDFSLWKKNL